LTEARSEDQSAYAGLSGKRSNTMSKTSTKRLIEMPSEEDNAKILKAAKADPDAKPLTKAQLEAMVPMRALRGRPKLENKKLLLSVRYSPEVIAYFRGTGDGWQARMDGVLQEYVEKQVSKRGRKAA
jgi:uncharacterized protein (DUF4415 family)